MKYVMHIFFISLLFWECKKKEKLGIKSMKVIMWDMSKVEAFGTNYLISTSSFKKDSILKVKYAEVFALHHTTQAQFFASLDAYKKNPTEYRALIDSLNIYASKQRDQYFNQQIENADTTAKPIAQ